MCKMERNEDKAVPDHGRTCDLFDRAAAHFQVLSRHSPGTEQTYE
jgi:hypothetical protein